MSHLWTYKAWTVGLDVISAHNISARAAGVNAAARLKSSYVENLITHSKA